MQFPKLTPLQSRFAASLVATLVLVIIYLALSPHHFAYAAELDSVIKEDHNHHWLLEDARLDGGRFADHISESDQENPVLYEPEFFGADRGIIGRADEGTTTLSNNAPNSANLTGDSTSYYVFPKASLFGPPGVKGASLPPALVDRRSAPPGENSPILSGTINAERDEHNDSGLSIRQTDNDATRTAYISINVCSQPNSDGTAIASIPQLTLYVSTSQSNQKPGPDATENAQVIDLVGGFANYTLNASGDIFIGVHAPSLPSNFAGEWNYEIAASIDASYHGYDDQSPFLFLVDSDSNSALFLTDDLTQANSTDEEYQRLIQSGGPFTMFTFPMNSPAIQGVQNSYCALRNIFTQSNVTVDAGMTTRGEGNKPKEQLFVQGLNRGSAYYGILAMNGSSNDGNGSESDKAVIGGGGQIWQALNFTTKSDGNCQLIFNLSFCSDVAYAVPSNPQVFNMSALAQLYDNYTSSMYQNFNYSLQQIPCDTASTAQYSLARNCTNCATDYKNWLCAVSIPRCDDFSSQEAYLQPRNVAANFINGSAPDSNSNDANATLRERLYANSSRNPLIDEQIQPGPYKELLPCEDLCYSLVQSCPAKLGFACPLPGLGLEVSYGKRSDGLTCSYLGAIHSTSSSHRASARPLVAAGFALLASIAVVLLS